MPGGRQAMRRPSRSATPAMPCGLPRATTRPCSRLQRCTSSTGAPPKAPRAMGSFQRPLATSKRCRVAASAAPRASCTMPLTLPRPRRHGDCVARRSYQYIEPGRRCRRGAAPAPLLPSAPPARRRHPPRRSATEARPRARRHPEARCTRVPQSPVSTRPLERPCATPAGPRLQSSGRARFHGRDVLRATPIPSVPMQEDTDGRRVADEGRGPTAARMAPYPTHVSGSRGCGKAGLRRYARERCTGAPFGRAGYGFASRSKNCP